MNGKLVAHAVVATRNPLKVRGTRKAFELVFGAAEAVPVEPPDLPPQPLTLSETTNGAVQRAKWAIRAFFRGEGENDSRVTFGVGVEAGLQPTREALTGFLSYQICAVADPDGRVTLGASPGFEYPPAVVRKVTSARQSEVADAMAEVTGDSQIKTTTGAIGYLSKGLLDREELTRLGVLMALVPRIRPQLYQA
ncbi:MAG: inosine/xanthosine triphosphatase [Promethearchaeota archaeon]